MKELLERWIELLSKSGSNTKQQVLEEMKASSQELPTIAYICDKKKCANCNGECTHTLDINHAVNFVNYDGVYFEGD